MPARGEKSPRITALSWGRVEIEGGRSFKDAKLYPGGARAWDWRETGMHHVPGIRPAEVEELVERGATTLVLSRGVWERLEVAADTLQWLKDKGVAVEVLQTERAVERYNELCDTTPVGALIHSTC